MMVLHASLFERQVYVWAEVDIKGTLPAYPKRRGRGLTPHPFCADAEALGAALTASGLEVVEGEETLGAVEEVVAWLPGTKQAPSPSSGLVGPQGQDEQDVEADGVHPWRVTAIALEVEQVLWWLESSPLKGPLAAGVVAGHDLTWLGEVARFAARLVAQQRVIPSARREGATVWATWQPLLSAVARHQRKVLAEQMPAVGRCLSRDALPHEEPLALTQRLVEATVDALMRTAQGPQTDAMLARGYHRNAEKKLRFDSVHDYWLYALYAGDGEMGGITEAQANALLGELSQWQGPLLLLNDAPFRLSLRLSPPPTPTVQERRRGRRPTWESDPQWRLDYFVQSAEDLSLLIPAEAIWEGRAAAATLSSHTLRSPRDFLLAALGQAAKLNAEIARSLTTRAPTGCDLDDAAAFTFLTESAPALEQAGFEVRLPTWWRGQDKPQLTRRAKASAPKGAVGTKLTMRSLVDVQWEVALGDQVITPAELDILARVKTPLVQLRGQWVVLTPQTLRAAAALFKQPAAEQLPLSDLVRRSLSPSAPTDDDAPIAQITGTGRVKALLDQFTQDSPQPAPDLPDTIKATLRPYQARGVGWLLYLRSLGFGACLADDMGLGKTLQTLAMIAHQKAAGDDKPTLLICPTSVLTNWQREAARFTPSLKVYIHHGPKRAKGARFAAAARRHDLVLSSYSLLHRDLDAFNAVGWSAVVLDEAQNIKNPTALQSLAARKLASPGFRLALTGTPVENQLTDLWSLMDFANPGWVGDLPSFRRRFILPIQADADADATASLKRLTQPFILRRLKTDRAIIADLPEKQEMKVYCALTPEQATLYRAITQALEEALDAPLTAKAARATKADRSDNRAGQILATITKLKQVCNHPAQLLADGSSSTPQRSGKLTRLCELVGEVAAAGERALIFTQFTAMGSILQQALQAHLGQAVPILTGELSRAKRDALVARFQGDADAPPALILSLKAGGTGLNLTRANHVFHFDRWWNPAVEAQATDRAFRIGQTRDVQVRAMLCAGTFEEHIDALIERKKALSEQVVGDGEGWLAALSNAEIKELLALRADAVVEE